MRAPHERNGLVVCCEHEEEYVFCKIDAKALKKLNDTHTLNKNATQKQPNTKKNHDNTLTPTNTHLHTLSTRYNKTLFFGFSILHAVAF